MYYKIRHSNNGRNVPLLLLISFLGFSCGQNIDAPIPVEIDNTSEIKENSGTIIYSVSQPPETYIVTPDMEPLPAGVIKREYFVLNDAGEAYKIGVNSEVKLLSKTEYSNINRAKLTVYLNSTEVTQSIFNVIFVKNPDLNSNGKTENNEKIYLAKIKEEISSTKINMLSGAWPSSVKTSGKLTINSDKSKNDVSKNVWDDKAVVQWFNDKNMTKSELKLLNNEKEILSLSF